MQESNNLHSMPSSRFETADQVPFFLRTWWLKDYIRADDVVWQNSNWLTLPLYSLQTDPYCDAGSIDFDIP